MVIIGVVEVEVVEGKVAMMIVLKLCGGMQLL